MMIMVSMATVRSPTGMGTTMAHSGMVGTQPTQEVTERSKERSTRDQSKLKKLSQQKIILFCTAFLFGKTTTRL